MLFSTAKVKDLFVTDKFFEQNMERSISRSYLPCLLCKSLQKYLLFRNFAQSKVVVRWATANYSFTINQLDDDHRSVVC